MTKQLVALGLVEAYIALTGVICALVGRRRERQALRAKFAPYTMKDEV